jgi:mRNA interferase MazF
MAAKVRPCLVISTQIKDSDRALITLVPHTTSTRETSFEAPVPAQFLKTGAFDAQGLVTVPVNRAIRLLGKLKPDQMRGVEVAVCRWLELPCSR